MSSLRSGYWARCPSVRYSFGLGGLLAKWSFCSAPMSPFPFTLICIIQNSLHYTFTFTELLYPTFIFLVITNYVLIFRNLQGKFISARLLTCSLIDVDCDCEHVWVWVECRMIMAYTMRLWSTTMLTDMCPMCPGTTERQNNWVTGQ